ATSEEFLAASWAAAADGAENPIDLGSAGFHELDDVRKHAAGLGVGWGEVSPFALDESRTVAAEPAPQYRGDLEAALADLVRWRADQRHVVVVAPAHGPAQRTVEWLAEHDVPATIVDHAEGADGV